MASTPAHRSDLAPRTTAERDAFALRLYAAYVDIAEERIPEFNRMRFPERTMADWRRVADEALGVREPKHIVPIKAAEPAPAPVVPISTKRLPGRPPRAIINVEPIWCGQCDRRVPVPQVKLCQSQFCSAKGLLP